MYKRASKIKLRFLTSRGPLTVEQLWDLPLSELDTLAISLQEGYKKSGKKSFLETKSKKDRELKLAFDIVLDVLNTKVELSTVAAKTAETKAHNQKILGKIADARDKDLAGKTVEELTVMLK